MKRIILSLGAITFVAALALGATGAFFSDTETSTGNTFTAGAIDLTVDSQAHYAGLTCTGGIWVEDVQASSTRQDLIGDPCSGTWALTDLGPTNTFFNLGDLKPGDSGENTISLHVSNNDAYACAIVDNLQDNDNGLTEPEGDDGDVTPGPLGGGELSSQLRFFAWGETDGDNVWEANEPTLFSNIEGPASDVLGGVSYPLFTPQTVPMIASTTQYIGLYWCYGAITVGANTLSCDGSTVDNITQTDSMTADISFYVEQARNNPNFVCPAPTTTPPVVEEIGADLAAFVDAPSCNVTVDIGSTTLDTIQEAIDSSLAGNTVCVPDGTFTENVVINKDITLSGSGATSTSIITGNVAISADGATLEGFQINGNVTSDFHGVTVQYNKILPLAGGNGITWGGVAGAGSTIRHNVVTTFATTSPNNRGIYLDQNGTTAFVVDYNTVTARKNGFGILSSGTVQHSVFSGYNIGSAWEVTNDIGDVIVISINNFNQTGFIGVANLGALTFNALSNWWGDASSAGNTSGLVTTSDDQAVAYPQNP